MDAASPPASQVIGVPNDGWDPRVRQFRYGSLVDSFAVLTSQYTVLVDTLVNPESVTEVLRLLTVDHPERRQPLLVVNTHGDWDHVWGNCVFDGAHPTHPAIIIGSRLAAEAMTSPRSLDLLLDYQKAHPREYARVEWVPPNIAVDGGARIDGGDLSLELIPSPGHTPDHLVVWIPEIKLLLAGDAAEASMPYVNGADTLPQVRETLRQLVDLQPETVLASHAPGNHSPDLLPWNLTYFDQLEAHCRRSLALGAEPEKVLGEWTLDSAVPARWQPPIDLTEFYTNSHARAVSAMCTWIRQPG